MNAETDFNLHDALKSSAMLVTITMSAWSPIKTDRRLSDDVAAARDGIAAAFSVRKNTLRGADHHFRAISKTQQDFRRWVYAHTLPFGISTSSVDRGPRLLSNSLLMTFLQRAGRARQEMQDELAEAKAAFRDAVEQARHNLGDAFDPADYPDVDDLDKLFSIEVDVSPVPSRGGFHGLDGDLQAQMDDFMQSRMARKTRAALAEVQDRVVATLSRIRERLDAVAAAEDDETITRKPAIYASMFEAAGEVADIVDAYAPALGTTPELAEASRFLREFSAMDRDAVRTTALPETRDRVQALYDCFEV